MERLLFLRGLPPRYLLIYIAIGVLLVYECKLLYWKMKKETRFGFYNSYASEVRNEAVQVETADNKSYTLILKLNTLLGLTSRKNRTVLSACDIPSSKENNLNNKNSFSPTMVDKQLH